MQRVFTAAMAIGALGIAAIPAHAITPQVAAASCIPVSGPYKVLPNKVTFKAGKTGTIVLHCHMNQAELGEADAPGIAIVATYRDSGGAAATGQVKIMLIGVAKGLGNETPTLQFNSNTETAANGVTSAVGNPVPVITTDFFYLMRVEMKRARTSQKVELYGFSYEAT